MHTRLHINGIDHELDLPAGTSLLCALRDQLQLLGSRYGCGHGVCGACYVLIDGQAAPACKLEAAALEGRTIRTIEDIAEGAHLHRVQQAFIDEDAMQCGFCTSGMIISTVALLARNADPSDADIRRALSSHLCRCGVYLRALRAVRRAVGRASR
jgi:aerobic-type carbon monoxide dehydrogenase small subunit (CoxS/CutS family)